MAVETKYARGVLISDGSGCRKRTLEVALAQRQDEIGRGSR